jgi:hypothetical protein
MLGIELRPISVQFAPIQMLLLLIGNVEDTGKDALNVEIAIKAAQHPDAKCRRLPANTNIA